MKVEKSFHIEEIVGADQTRQNLTHVMLETDRKRLLATDGRACVIVPCEIERDDTSGYVTAQALKYARRVGGKRERLMEIQPNGSLVIPGAGSSFARPLEAEVGRFPDVDQVIPQMRPGDEGTVTIGLDAQLLAAVSRAIGCHGRSRGGVLLVVSLKDHLAPILVLPNDDRSGTVVGVIMPQRMD